MTPFTLFLVGVGAGWSTAMFLVGWWARRGVGVLT